MLFLADDTAYVPLNTFYILEWIMWEQQYFILSPPEKCRFNNGADVENK